MSQLIQQNVIVKKTDGGFAWVILDEEFSSAGGCGSCSSKNACGSSSFLTSFLDSNSDENSENKYLKLPNTINAEAGDKVLLELHSKNLLKSTFLAYLLPLASLLLFALIGRLLFGEATSAILGIAGLFIGLYLVKFIVSNTSFKKTIEPVMVSLNKGLSSNNKHIIQPY